MKTARAGGMGLGPCRGKEDAIVIMIHPLAERRVGRNKETVGLAVKNKKPPGNVSKGSR